MSDSQHQEEDFSLKKFFVPLTTFKVIHIIVILGFIVFGNMLFNGFVWDDKTFILLNPEVHSINLSKLLGINLFNNLVYYRPIPAIYFAILYALFTTNAFPYHLLQLCLHIINAILLYVLFKEFFKKYLSVLLSLLFLVHPMQVESVSYIAQTVSPLYFLFGISGLLLIIRKGGNTNIFLLSLLLLLSLLTKETGLVFLLLVNLYNYLYRKVNQTKLFIASFGTLLVYFFIRFEVGHVFFAKSLLVAPIAHSPLFVRLLTIPNVALYYIKTFFYPIILGINQDWIITSPSITNFYTPLFIELLSIVLLGLLGKYCFKHTKSSFRTYIFFVSWFIIGFLFHLQIIPLDMTVADRWFYTTMVGLLGLLGLFVSLIESKQLVDKKILILILLSLIILMSMRTIVRNTNWRDAITLYTHDIKVDDNFDIENSLGYEYIQDHQYDKAITHLKKSIHYWPDWDKNWQNLGGVYHLQGRVAQAKKAYEIAAQNNPANTQVIENLGYLLVNYYDANAARAFLVKASTQYPEQSKIWYYLSLANYKLGDKNEALRNITVAYSLNPSDKKISDVYSALQNNVLIQFQK